MLGKLACEATWGWHLGLPPEPGLLPFTLLTQGRLAPTGSWGLGPEESGRGNPGCRSTAGRLEKSREVCHQPFPPPPFLRSGLLPPEELLGRSKCQGANDPIWTGP